MGTFRYKVRDKFGKAVSGVISGDTKETVAAHLSSMGYAPISVEEIRQSRVAGVLKFFNRVSLEDLNLFTRQLVTLQKAGLPLLSGLAAIRRNTENRYFALVIGQIMADIESGSGFSAALAGRPGIFNELYVNMVKAGESAGTLDDMLERLAQLGEDELLMRSRIKSAFRYPAIVAATLVGAFFVVVGFVLPRFAVLFASYKVRLPLPTRLLLAVSVVIKNFWFVILLVLAAALFASIRFIKSPIGRPLWDGFKLRVYVFGRLMLMIVMSRFSRVAAMLIKSGLPILQVLELVKKTIGNIIVERAVENIRSSVAEGKGISEPMRISNLFPSMVVQMVAIGEETGKIDELLLRVAEYYDSQIEYTLKNLTTLIEPVLIFFLGFAVLAMSLAIFLPMWNMTQLFKR